MVGIFLRKNRGDLTWIAQTRTVSSIRKRKKQVISAEWIFRLVAIAPSHIAKSSSERKEENDYETFIQSVAST